MNVLAFDTCMAACSAALIQGDTGRVHHRYALMERGHSETLFPMVKAVMEEAQLDFDELDLIAVTRGPGTFTGVRAGVAAARGFALASGVPVVSATSLDVMAFICRERLDLGNDSPGFLLAHDARRGELYVQSFDAAASALSDQCLRRLRRPQSEPLNSGW